MLSEATSVLEVGDRLIQFGYRRKRRVVRRITFARPFIAPPRVVLTPCWENARWEDGPREVRHAETIGEVTEDHCLLFSDNAASDYLVSWMAVGYARGRPGDHNLDYVHAGDLILEVGRTAKSTVSVTERLRYPFAHPPNLQLSPFWEGQRRGVGHAETLGRVAQDSFDVWSDNRAANYHVSWLAAGTWRTDLPPREAEAPFGRGWFYSDFPVRDMLIRTMRGPRRSGGDLNVSIGPGFVAPPTVIVTPFWEGQRRGVGHAETLNWVEPHFVRLASGNGAENYFLSMLAIGPRG